MIKLQCAMCGKRISAPESAAGKTGKCPGCQQPIQVPKVVEPEIEEEYCLAPDPPATTQPARSPSPAQPAAVNNAARPFAIPKPAALTNPATASATTSAARPAWVPTTKSSTPSWLRHLHWLLALAMIPLAVTILLPDESLEQRVRDTLEEARPKAAPTEPSTDGSIASSTQPNSTPADAQPPDSAEPDIPFEGEIDLFNLLPGHKLKGALLSRDSHMQWLFALLAIIAYMVFFTFLASDNSAKPLHVLGVGAFTATAGVALLMGIQFLASAAAMGRFRVRGIIGLVILAFLLIGLSYRIALDPESSLVASFLGFTFGVGLCEEICKAIPMLMAHKIGIKQSWRGAFIWGLASGAGFGVAEGILYSYDMYNGVSGIDAYLVRFVSCVALHAVWAGSVGITIEQNAHMLQEEHDEESWWMWILILLRMIAVPMVLHGLYDTLLKKDLPFFALLTAIASFGWLAFVIYRLRNEDDMDERAAFVARYIRSKAAAG